VARLLGSHSRLGRADAPRPHLVENRSVTYCDKSWSSTTVRVAAGALVSAHGGVAERSKAARL
jgi:hypothetical protein